MPQEVTQGELPGYPAHEGEEDGRRDIVREIAEDADRSRDPLPIEPPN